MTAAIATFKQDIPDCNYECSTWILHQWCITKKKKKHMMICLCLSKDGLDVHSAVTQVY